MVPLYFSFIITILTITISLTNLNPIIPNHRLIHPSPSLSLSLNLSLSPILIPIRLNHLLHQTCIYKKNLI